MDGCCTYWPLAKNRRRNSEETFFPDVSWWHSVDFAVPAVRLKLTRVKSCKDVANRAGFPRGTVRHSRVLSVSEWFPRLKK